jgi:hypothetical protein
MTAIEERLREIAQACQRSTEPLTAVAEQEAQDSTRRLSHRARDLAAPYLESAASRRTAMRPGIHHGLRCRVTDRGFLLDAGGGRELEANFASDKWHVTIRHEGAHAAQHTFESDTVLLEAQDDLLRQFDIDPQASAGSKDRPSGDEEPPPVSFINAPSRQRAHARNYRRKAARREVKLVLYAIAFAIGLSFSAIFTRHTDRPPRVGNGPEAVATRVRFHVQAGVFNAKEDGQTLVRRLRSLGYTATLVNDIVYRVFVGGYVDRGAAERLAATLRRAGFEAVLQP